MQGFIFPTNAFRSRPKRRHKYRLLKTKDDILGVNHLETEQDLLASNEKKKNFIFTVDYFSDLNISSPCAERKEKSFIFCSSEGTERGNITTKCAKTCHVPHV